MSLPKKFTACRSHLGMLFDALEKGDMKAVENLEHLLTPIEECVACSYGFRIKGTVVNEFEDFLRKQGFTVDASIPASLVDQVWYWAIRLGILVLIFALFLAIERSIMGMIFKNFSYNPLSLNVVEFLSVTLGTLLIFIFIDDTMLD